MQCPDSIGKLQAKSHVDVAQQSFPKWLHEFFGAVLALQSHTVEAIFYFSTFSFSDLFGCSWKLEQLNLQCCLHQLQQNLQKDLQPFVH